MLSNKTSNCYHRSTKRPFVTVSTSGVVYHGGNQDVMRIRVPAGHRMATNSMAYTLYEGAFQIHAVAATLSDCHARHAVRMAERRLVVNVHAIAQAGSMLLHPSCGDQSYHVIITL